MAATSAKPDYGVDAPDVLRNLFLSGSLLIVLVFVTPSRIHIGKIVFVLHSMFAWTGGFLLAEACLFLLYVKFGKFRHRDLMLGIANIRGTERVLDVGCGRGLLLAGAAKRLRSGRAVGVDIWSNTDMGGNSAEATLHNLSLEGVAGRCELVSAGAQAMPFAEGSFDLILSNLCLHNIYERAIRLRALDEIVRVLQPGGLAILSDYKHVGEYAEHLRSRGLEVTTKWGNPLWTFPPLRMAIARKPTKEIAA